MSGPPFSRSPLSGPGLPFTQNIWLFFLLTPVPIACTVFGFVLKAKGYPGKKNIIAGLIITGLLCLYGSFAFLIP